MQSHDSSCLYQAWGILLEVNDDLIHNDDIDDDDVALFPHLEGLRDLF